jgi:hypothetical protein
MTEVLLEKKLGGLSPVGDDAYRILGKIPAGAKVSVDVRAWGRRSTMQHNYGFALLNHLFEAQELYPTLDHFREALLIHLGRCSRYPQRDGTEIVIADSMSFAKMSRQEYASLIDEILGFAAKMGFDRAALATEAAA